MASLNTRNFSPGVPKQVGVTGTTTLGPLLAALPTVAADLTTTDTWVFQLHLANTTAGALTVTITDKQAAPIAAFSALSIGANAVAVFSWPEGLFFKGGLNWVVSGAGGVNASIVAFAK